MCSAFSWHQEPILEIGSFHGIFGLEFRACAGNCKSTKWENAFIAFSTNNMRWKPNLTVAAVIERDGRFLTVEEQTADGLMLNQPAGHLERGETLTAAVIREVMEESAHPFTPAFLVGVYHWPDRDKDVTYLRFAFGGSAGTAIAGRALDHGIARALWLSRDELAAARLRHRSPYVLACVDDYLAGRRFPLDLVRHFEDAR
jgi:8-oxo-dGTP pyrophosphatase MutT (NUDIX family)